MRRFIIIASGDRAAARRVVGRIDQIMGYPRTLAESEIVRHGRESLRPARPYVETYPAVLLHTDGRIAIELDARVDTIMPRTVDAGGGRKRLSRVITDRGWRTREGLPGRDDDWSSLPARDGADGSADGVPIPEGEE